VRPIKPVFAAALFASFAAHAADARPPASAGGWQWETRAAAVHRFESDLDSGGDVSVDRAYASLSASNRLDDNTRIGFSLGYGEDRYDFAGNGALAGLSPWDRIRRAKVGASLFHQINDRWTAYALPSVQFDAEKGASLSDGRSLGLLAGASYKFGDSLTLGPGFGVFEQIEDDVSFFPVLIVDWKITDALSLETGRGFAASRGPGLQLRWRPDSKLEFTAGARYETSRFRLDDKGAAPDGVGEAKAVPVFLSAEYKVSPAFSLSVIGGAETAASMRLEDSDGKRITDSDSDTAPFLGLGLRWRL
jgi:outer membrane receptor protein involved in Fe transport